MVRGPPTRTDPEPILPEIARLAQAGA